MSELFPTAPFVSDSPRLAWMKSHGIVAHDRGADFFGGPAARWIAWSTADREEALANYSAFCAPTAATEEDALLLLALGLGLRLWNEEQTPAA